MSSISSFQQAYEEYSKQNFQKSYSLFDEYLETLRQDSVMLQERGMIFINLEKYEEALIYLDKILIINPDDIEILIRKGKSCEALGKTEHAIECFNHISIENRDSTYYVLLEEMHLITWTPNIKDTDGIGWSVGASINFNNIKVFSSK